MKWNEVELTVRLILLVITLDSCCCARILSVIPTPSISHQEPFRPMMRELLKRGHDVVLITANPSFPKGKAPVNLIEIDVHDIAYERVINMYNVLTRGIKSDWINQIQQCVFDFYRDLIDDQLESEAVKAVIRDGKFDLLILEAIARPALGLTHVIKAPVILVSSLGAMFDNADAIGAPTHPLLYPSSYRQNLYNLSYWEKAVELYNYFKVLHITKESETSDHEMLQKHFGKDIPTIDELRNNIDMLMVNMHPIFEGSYPVPPNVINIWGIHNKPRKELPLDLRSFLDSSKQGIIYTSFGTNTDVTLLPKEKIKIFVNVFCKLPYNILLKWNSGDLPGKCPNIFTRKWFPQTDLLAHPNIKLFITQGGLQSTDEALTAGVPLIGIPMIGDQWFNVEKYVYHKIGMKLEFESLTEEQLEDAIKTVIQDRSYRENVKKLNALLHDEPMPALERAVWWIEYVIRHGGTKHQRAPAANISWTQYFEIELVLISLAVVFTTLITFILLLKCTLTKLFARFRTKVKRN